ncbi:hypothetical protein CHARACLAT_022270 [Characodon lateralis]|uniref:Uncharacterized protein n=1 Tax=Characodon lateralis TaxID=208331 RepID=A0ABU7EXB7_9TELE|nr:hypothetical protein [Characodon lateralis]
MQMRLARLKDRSRCLEQLILQEEQRAEAEELEGSVLRSCTVTQLRDMSQTLQDLVMSENRMQIPIFPPPSILRLQEQEQALNLSIKEATAKVVLSQRLGSSLRRKVSETETQLLALHEAKLAAISGNDFGCAKELKAEMKAVYLERDRLEALAKRLHCLSLGSSQELARMKEQQQQLRQELEQREALHAPSALFLSWAGKDPQSSLNSFNITLRLKALSLGLSLEFTASWFSVCQMVCTSWELLRQVPGGELNPLEEEKARQTWQAQAHSEGLLGTPGGALGQGCIQLPPPGEL